MAPAPFITRVRSARKLGEEAAKKAADRADQDAPGFSERALEHIRVTMLAAAPGAHLRGEDIVNAAKVAGIRPRMIAPSAPSSQRPSAWASLSLWGSRPG